MAIYYDRIRKSLQDILNRIEADQRSGVVSQSASQRTARLYTYFSELLVARDGVFEKFDSLFEERSKIYGTMLSALHLNIFNSRLQVSNIVINYLYKFVELISSGEFIDYSRRAVYYSNNSSNGDDKDELSSYFTGILSALMDLVYEDVAYSYSSNTLTISLGTPKVITVANADDQEFIDKALFLIGYLSESTNYGSSNTFINQYSEFVIGDAEGSMFELSISKIEESVDNIKRIIDTVNHIDFNMENNDQSYSKDYTSSILSLYSDLSKSLENFSEISISAIARLREIGEVERFTALVLEIDSSSKQLVEDIIDSIKAVEKFLEDFAPFVPSGSDYTSRLLKSIEVYETINYNSDLPGIRLVNPFSIMYILDGQSGTGETDENPGRPISDWISKIIGTNVIDSDIYNLLAIVVGAALLREKSTEEIGKDLRDFALMNMIRRNYIDEKSDAAPLKGTFIAKRDLERTLAGQHGLTVRENYQEDIIPFVYKRFLPKLEVLDYMTFSEVSDFGNAGELAFRENVKTLILEAFAREKRNFNNIMTSIIVNLQSTRPDTLKGVYMEVCFREVAEKFSDYLNGQTNGVVDRPTLDAIDSFVSRHGETDNDPLEDAKTRISEYISVWNYFYDSANGLAEDALEDGDLKDLIT